MRRSFCVGVYNVEKLKFNCSGQVNVLRGVLHLVCNSSFQLTITVHSQVSTFNSNITVVAFFGLYSTADIVESLSTIWITLKLQQVHVRTCTCLPLATQTLFITHLTQQKTGSLINWNTVQWLKWYCMGATILTYHVW